MYIMSTVAGKSAVGDDARTKNQPLWICCQFLNFCFHFHRVTVAFEAHVGQLFCEKGMHN